MERRRSAKKEEEEKERENPKKKRRVIKKQAIDTTNLGEAVYQVAKVCFFVDEFITLTHFLF
jgi:hypothetical protein